MKESIDIQVVGAEELRALNESLRATARSLSNLAKSLSELNTNFAQYASRARQATRSVSQVTSETEKAFQSTAQLRDEAEKSESVFQRLGRTLASTAKFFRQHREALLSLGVAFALIGPHTERGQKLMRSFATFTARAFRGIGESMQRLLVTPFTAFARLVRSVQNVLRRLAAEVLGALRRISAPFEDIAKRLLGGVRVLRAEIGKTFREILPRTLVAEVEKLATSARDVFLRIWRTLPEGLRGILESLGQYVRTFKTVFVDEFKAAFVGAYGPLRELGTTLKNTFKYWAELGRPSLAFASSLAVLLGTLSKFIPRLRRLGSAMNAAGWAVFRGIRVSDRYRQVVERADRMNRKFTGSTRQVARGFKEIGSGAADASKGFGTLLEAFGKAMEIYFFQITMGHVIENIGHTLEMTGRRVVGSAQEQMMTFVHYERLLYDLQRAQKRYNETLRGASSETIDWTREVIRMSVHLGQQPEMVARSTVTLLDLASAFKLSGAETKKFIGLLFDVATFLDESVFQALRHVRGAMMGLSYSAILLGINVEELRRTTELYTCLLYTSPSPRDAHESRMPSSA